MRADSSDKPVPAEEIIAYIASDFADEYDAFYYTCDIYNLGVGKVGFFLQLQ